jgi:YggT family protein
VRALNSSYSGVDVSPIVWVALLSFLNEILLGKQGLLILLASKA